MPFARRTSPFLRDAQCGEELGRHLVTAVVKDKGAADLHLRTHQVGEYGERHRRPYPLHIMPRDADKGARVEHVLVVTEVHGGSLEATVCRHGPGDPLQHLVEVEPVDLGACFQQGLQLSLLCLDRPDARLFRSALLDGKQCSRRGVREQLEGDPSMGRRQSSRRWIANEDQTDGIGPIVPHCDEDQGTEAPPGITAVAVADRSRQARAGAQVMQVLLPPFAPEENSCLLRLETVRRERSAAVIIAPQYRGSCRKRELLPCELDDQVDELVLVADGEEAMPAVTPTGGRSDGERRCYRLKWSPIQGYAGRAPIARNDFHRSLLNHVVAGSGSAVGTPREGPMVHVLQAAESTNPIRTGAQSAGSSPVIAQWREARRQAGVARIPRMKGAIHDRTGVPRPSRRGRGRYRQGRREAGNGRLCDCPAARAACHRYRGQHRCSYRPGYRGGARRDRPRRRRQGTPLPR